MPGLNEIIKLLDNVSDHVLELSQNNSDTTGDNIQLINEINDDVIRYLQIIDENIEKLKKYLLIAVFSCTFGRWRKENSLLMLV